MMSYCLTPHGTTGISPSELLFGRRPRSILDLLKPHTAERVENRLLRQKEQHDATAKHRELQVGDRVFARNYGPGEKWLPGTIERQTGPVSLVTVHRLQFFRYEIRGQTTPTYCIKTLVGHTPQLKCSYLDC